jgi:hypothetical protein
VKRPLRRIALALGMLPACATLALWGRSYVRLDELSLADAEGRTFAAVSFRGGVHVSRSGGQAARRRLEWDATPVPAGADWGAIYRNGQVDWAWFGFARLSEAPRAGIGTPLSAGATGRTFANAAGVALVPWLNSPPYVAYVVPYWALALVTAGPFSFRAARAGRRWSRRRAHRCVTCGYDLRATPGRCPECGAAAEPVPTGLAAAPLVTFPPPPAS